MLAAYAAGAGSEAERGALEDLAYRTAPVFLDAETEPDHTYQGRLFWPSSFRDEVLARLLALNAARAAEEARHGLGPAPGEPAAADAEEKA